MPGTKYCANSGPAIVATPVLSFETNLLSDNIQRSSQASLTQALSSDNGSSLRHGVEETGRGCPASGTKLKYLASRAQLQRPSFDIQLIYPAWGTKPVPNLNQVSS